MDEKMNGNFQFILIDRKLCSYNCLHLSLFFPDKKHIIFFFFPSFISLTFLSQVFSLTKYSLSVALLGFGIKIIAAFIRC